MKLISLLLSLTFISCSQTSESNHSIRTTIQSKEQSPSFQKISAKNINYFNINGRHNLSDDFIEYDWPGTSIEFKFKGTQLSLTIGGSDEFYDVYINKQILIPISTQPGQGLQFHLQDDSDSLIFHRPASFKIQSNLKSISLFKDYPNKEYHVKIIKRNETMFNTGKFFGIDIGLDGELITLDKSKLNIEFIGDSYVVGYGNLSPGVQAKHIQEEASRNCSDYDLKKYTHTGYSYPSLVAQELNANFQINAYSGLGIARHYNGNEFFKPYSQYYQKTLMSQENSNYKFKWHPDIIVMALGTNDFSTDLQSHESKIYPDRSVLYGSWNQNYKQLIKQLIDYHPQSKFILIANNLHPHDEMRKQMRLLHSQLLKDSTFNSRNIKKRFNYLELDNNEGYGCSWHPSYNTHKSWTQSITNLIKNLNE